MAVSRLCMWIVVTKMKSYDLYENTLTPVVCDCVPSLCCSIFMCVRAFVHACVRVIVSCVNLSPPPYTPTHTRPHPHPNHTHTHTQKNHTI